MNFSTTHFLKPCSASAPLVIGLAIACSLPASCAAAGDQSSYLERNQTALTLYGALTTDSDSIRGQTLDSGDMQEYTLRIERGLNKHYSAYLNLSHHTAQNDAKTLRSESERIGLGFRYFPFKWSSIKPYTSFGMAYTFNDNASDRVNFDSNLGVLFPIGRAHIDIGLKTTVAQFEVDSSSDAVSDISSLAFIGVGFSF